MIEFDIDKIISLRERHNLSQSAFARKINANRQMVHRWENETAQPSMASLVKMCNVFKRAPGYFFVKKNVQNMG